MLQQAAEPATSPGVYVALSELIAFRHRVREAQLFSMPGRRSPLVGLHHSKLRGRGMDFDQVRSYLPGDDVRNIDWRVTARTQEVHTKVFHEERERPIYILVEQSRQLFFGSSLLFKSVLAAHAASLIGWSALDHNDRIGGLVFGAGEHHEIRPRRRKQSLLQLLSRLSQANLALHTDTPMFKDSFAQALRRSREVLRPGSLVAVLCDERSLNDNSAQQLSLLARHSDLLLLPISDPLDHSLPQAGLLRFANKHNELELDSNNQPLAQAYQNQALERQNRWQRLAQKLAVPLLKLSTDKELVEQLRAQIHPLHSGVRA